MSRRAPSLVVLIGFFTFFTLSADLLVAQAPRKAIESASDLPAFSYPVTGSQDDVIRSEEAYRPFAEKLRRDIDSLLRDYVLEDRHTLRGLHETLLYLDPSKTERRRPAGKSRLSGTSKTSPRPNCGQD